MANIFMGYFENTENNETNAPDMLIIRLLCAIVNNIQFACENSLTMLILTIYYRARKE